MPTHKSKNAFSKHHYVPRAFFRPWENKARDVLVYERKNGLVLPPYWQSTSKICVQEGLYSYTESVPSTRRNVLEEYLFKAIDNHAMKVLVKCNTQNDLEINHSEREVFSIFLLSLRMRTPEFFLGNASAAEKHFRDILAASEDDPELHDLKDYMQGKTFLQYAEANYLHVIENKGRQLFAEFLTAEKFFKPIYDLDWSIVKFDKFELGPLVTSDRPLIVLSKNNKIFFLAISISPNRLFVASDDLKIAKKLHALSREKLYKLINISTIQQAQYKAFAQNRYHSDTFFKNRLGQFHSVLPRGRFLPLWG